MVLVVAPWNCNRNVHRESTPSRHWLERALEEDPMELEELDSPMKKNLLKSKEFNSTRRISAFYKHLKTTRLCSDLGLNVKKYCKGQWSCRWHRREAAKIAGVGYYSSQTSLPRPQLLRRNWRLAFPSPLGKKDFKINKVSTKYRYMHRWCTNDASSFSSIFLITSFYLEVDLPFFQHVTSSCLHTVPQGYMLNRQTNISHSPSAWNIW